MSLPITDEDVLIYTREILAGGAVDKGNQMLHRSSHGAAREFVTGSVIANEIRTRFDMTWRNAPKATSCTAALNRLAKQRKLRKIQLVGRRGKPRGFGYQLKER